MSQLRYGPARVPSRESPEAAVELLLERGYTACEIDFEGKFWMDYPWAERFGEVAREAEIALSVHAPIAGFMGHVERDKKQRMAVGMLDHSAGVAVACGAEVVVFHPGFLLGRERADAIDSVVEQLAELRERLEGKGRAVPFGVEVMGRVRELAPPTTWSRSHAGSAGCGRCSTSPTCMRPATAPSPMSSRSRRRWRRPTSVLETGAPFHIHFSDIQFANRNETKHLPYGEGTLRAEPLAEALARFERPATVITESPDEESNQAIWAALSTVAAASSSASRASKGSASSARPRSRRN